MDTALFAIPLFFIAALLYTSVGHGGASGYLAVMSLLGFAPALLRTTSLSLNILASSIALILFMQRSANTMAWRTLGRLLLPFAGLGIPMAYLGGSLTLTGNVYKTLIGCVLLWAAWSLVKPQTQRASSELPSTRWWMWPAGAGIGLLSGLTGVGGGIFLSPLLVLTGVISVKHSAPVSAALILLNSMAGLLGISYAGAALFAAELPAWFATVACGATIGAYWGSRKSSPLWMRRLLAAVLAVAGAKLLGVFSLLV